MRRIPVHYTMLDATATAVSAGIRVSDFRNCILSVVGNSSIAGKLFVMGAISTSDTAAAPDFTIGANVRSATDNWDYIEVEDLEDGAAIDGDDGITLAGNRVRLFEVNLNSFDWLAVKMTSGVAGLVSVVAGLTTNE